MTGELDHDRAVGVLLHDVVGPDVLHGPAGLGAIDAHAGADGRFGAELPGAARLARDGGGRHLEGGPLDDRDLAVDAIEPIVALLSAEVVEPGQVPAPALELEAVRVDGALLVPVPEAHRAAAGHRAEEAGQVGIGGERGDVHPQVAGPLGDQSAELEEPLGGRQPLDLDGRGGQVESRQLLGGEAGIPQGVLLPWDPVPVDLRQRARHGLDADRDPHGPKLVLVALERPPERGLVLRVLQLPLDLRRGQRSPRVEQERRQVEEPLELLPRHVPTLAKHRQVFGGEGAGGAGRAEEERILVRAAPHRRHAHAEVVEEPRHVGPLDDADVVARVVVGACLGGGDEHRGPGEVEGGARVVAHALVARAGSPSDIRSTAMGVPAEGGGGVEDAGHLEGAGAER